MKINIYDKQLNRVAIIGELYVSCLWSEGYNSIQNFTLELQDTEEYRKNIKEDYYVGRTDRKTLMVIKSIEYSGGSIVLSGKQAARVLDDVAFVGTITENQSIESSIKAAYDSSRKYPFVEVVDGGNDWRYKSQISNKSVLELCENMCQEEDVGFRVVKGENGIELEFYKPENAGENIFSSYIGNFELKELSISNEPYKNYAIVLGGGEGEDRIRVDVDASDGGQKYEMIVDAREIQRQEEETNEQYISRLTAKGIESLLEKKRTFDCSINPDAGEFGNKYDLGDVFTVNLIEYGIKLVARMVRFTQKAQKNKTTTTIEIGTITLKR